MIGSTHFISQPPEASNQLLLSATWEERMDQYGLTLGLYNDGRRYPWTVVCTMTGIDLARFRTKPQARRFARRVLRRWEAMEAAKR